MLYEVIDIIWKWFILYDWKQMKTDETIVTALKNIASFNIYFENNENWWKYNQLPSDETCIICVPKDRGGNLEQCYSAGTLSS